MEGEQSSNKMNLMSIAPIPRGSNEPWLIFQHGNKNKYQTFYNMSEGNYHLKSIPLMRGKHICACSHGWIVLGNNVSSKDCLLFNPTTMENIQLPLFDFAYWKCVLTSSPNDPTCTVLFISNPQDNVIVFWFCNPHQNSGGKVERWVKKEMKFDVEARFTDAASINGKTYAFMLFNRRTHDILVIETINDATLSVTKMGIEMPYFPLPDLPLVHGNRMVESCGEMYCVRAVFEEPYKPYKVLDFEIFKLDFSRKFWERVKSIGNRAFFVGPYSSSSASAKDTSGSKCGIIYFTMEKDKSLYAYNVEDKSIKISLPCPKVQNKWSEPDWFLPSYPYQKRIDLLV